MMVSMRWSWLKGRKVIFASALALLFLVHAMPTQRQRPFIGRRLSEDAALSAALDGLPVSPSAKSPVTPAVNVYGLDPSLLAALQQSGANASQAATRNSSVPTVPAPGPTTSSNASNSSPGMVSSSSVRGWPGPASAPAPSTWGQSVQSAPAGTQSAQPPSPLPPTRGTYAPLDPHLAAALENQGRVPPMTTTTITPSATGSASAPPPRGAATGGNGSIVPVGAPAPPAAAPAMSALVGSPDVSASPGAVQQVGSLSAMWVLGSA